ncbi:MAG: peptidoglycan DD-metalloendopeptidase family protein [Gammaproteobacteria bacterium]|nr:peptidoglycan DD-metalloendopeptidase family protein [Gammaproteobacteria bacterium]
MAKRSRFNLIHALVLVVSIAVIISVFLLMSADASATRSKLTSDQTPLDYDIQQVTLPLAIPEKLQAEEPLALEEQNEIPQEWLTIKVKSGDALAHIFKRNNLSPAELHQIMSLGKSTKRLKSLRPGDIFKFQISEAGQLQQLLYEYSPLKTLHIQRQDQQFSARVAEKEIEKRTAYTIGTIRSSLFEAGKDAGLSDSLIMEMVGVFGWDIDFALDIREGDQFALIYEEQFLDGEKVKDGNILAAEFINQGRTYRALRYTDAKGRSDYFTPEGLSMRKAFLRTPVDFRRISSRYGKRHHPTLNKMRLHKGVDYAAKTGTPIKASGDGKIIYRGTKGGYGRTIIIKHGGRYSTLYAHMSRYKKGLKAGRTVKQGQIIGYVGRSGRATGPHLHYEFRVNGVHSNPLTVKLPNAAPIKKQYKDNFMRLANALLAQLDMHKQTRIAMHQ